MKLSARNQLTGTVKEIKVGVVTVEVILDLGNDQTITSIISKDACEELGLAVGSKATAVVKSTSVLLMA
ncbi:molybdenum-pterin-binding protein [Heliobacillus mobilis]|uniref:Molybdenum-pterin-binding protein n=1 Tax=Heliobacterium mobile TaxID=28064 RepID=A0A6I3SNN8_HELMO|nr:TOBE domain-containing protein [Heliobacterium mobile]MTV50644.1 molybdenum-pterin-binding protein [Heliobacterium mobile]